MILGGESTYAVVELWSDPKMKCAVAALEYNPQMQCWPCQTFKEWPKTAIRQWNGSTQEQSRGAKVTHKGNPWIQWWHGRVIYEGVGIDVDLPLSWWKPI